MAESVIFLDLDGPMWSDRAIRFLPKNHYRDSDVIYFRDYFIIGEMMKMETNYIHMDPVAIGMINTLSDIHNFHVVISSSWAKFVDGKEGFVVLFEINNLRLHLHSDWETPKFDGSNRLSEIKKWLDDHPTVTQYAIIDDPWSGVDLMDHDMLDHLNIPPERVVLVNPTIGLEIEHFDQIMTIFNGEKTNAST